MKAVPKTGRVATYPGNALLSEIAKNDAPINSNPALRPSMAGRYWTGVEGGVITVEVMLCMF
jgi:hypothetical protein